MSGYNIGRIRYSGGFKRHKPVLISTLCKLTSVLNDAVGPYFDAMQDNVGLKRRNRLALTSIAGFMSGYVWGGLVSDCVGFKRRNVFIFRR